MGVLSMRTANSAAIWWYGKRKYVENWFLTLEVSIFKNHGSE